MAIIEVPEMVLISLGRSWIGIPMAGVNVTLFPAESMRVTF